MSRGVLLFLAIGLYLFWRFGSLSTLEIGLHDFSWRQFLLAIAIGWAMVLPLMHVFLVIGFRAWDTRVDLLGADFISYVVLAVFSSLLVGLFEETLFRGLFLTALQRKLSVLSASLVVSVFYAVVHFYDRDVIAATPVSWYTGVIVVGEALTPLAHPAEYWDSFITLFLLGMLFCWVRYQANLWWCVGLHAAWVFAIKVYKELTVRDVYNSLEGFVGSYDNFVGHLASFWLLFAFVCIALYQYNLGKRGVFKVSRRRASR
jgi:membrane protease YdiL (CAAX protease family)